MLRLLLLALLPAGVIGPFAPPQPYGPGHRGVDFAATPGAVVTTPVAGIVTFQGRINGVGTLTIAFGERKITYQPIRSSLAIGERVARGQRIGEVEMAPYHCRQCLHVGVRERGNYINPMIYTRAQFLPVGRASWISVAIREANRADEGPL